MMQVIKSLLYLLKDVFSKNGFDSTKVPFIVSLASLEEDEFRSALKILKQSSPKYSYTHPRQYLERICAVIFPATFVARRGSRINYQDWSLDQKNQLLQIYERLKDKLNAAKLVENDQVLSFFSVTDDYFAKIYGLKYIGRKARFKAHYDGHSEYEFRAIFVLDRSSNAPQLYYFQDKQYKKLIEPDIGAGVLMNGARTLHAVLPQDRSLCYRYTLVFTYTTNPETTAVSCPCNEAQQAFYKSSR